MPQLLREVIDRLLDRELIQERKSFADDEDPDFWNDLYSNFLDVSPQLLAGLEKSVSERDLGKAAKKTHELLGMCRNIGARELGMALDKILQYLRQRNELPPEADITQIRELYEQTLIAFEQLED
jgi:HPt (histidine-containing phosphotransfer) domain-containing protein